MAELDKEGSVTFWLKHEHLGWSTNNANYNFGPFTFGPIEVHAQKFSDQTIEIRMSGPFGKTEFGKQKSPRVDAKGLFVAITWKDRDIRLYLAGKEVEHQHLEL